MALIRPDPTFYPSPGMAMQAPPERLGYVTLLDAGRNGKRDAMGVIDPWCNARFRPSGMGEASRTAALVSGVVA